VPKPPAVIEVRLRELSQLFDSLDPSPFSEKDLDPKAEEYIVDSFRDIPSGSACSLLVHLDKSAPAIEPDSVVADAVHEHFAAQSRRTSRKLRGLIRRGIVSLGIGVLFLMAAFAASRLMGSMLGESGWRPLVEQGLLIVGWVAMWRPLEIFLYDWWPMVGDRRIYDRLSRIEVRVAATPAA
jgi:hypothetical protein